MESQLAAVVRDFTSYRQKTEEFMKIQEEQNTQELETLENACDFYKSEFEGMRSLLQHKESELNEFKGALDELSLDLKASKQKANREVDIVAKDYSIELRQAGAEIRALKDQLAVSKKKTDYLSVELAKKEDETDELAGELDGYIKKLSDSSVPAEIFEEVLKKKTELEEDNEKLIVSFFKFEGAV